MAVRFRKSVKITKGLKVNFSKSGTSLSLGGKGHSVNFSKRGTRATVGIPGTGLSYSTLSKSASSHPSRPNPSSSQTGSISVILDDWGNVVFQNENGVEITDKAVIRKLKASPAYQSHLAQLEELREETINKKIQEAEEENERFINIFALAPTVETIDAFENKYNTLRPKVFYRKDFTTPKPLEDSTRLELQQEAETTVKGFFLTVGKARKKYVEDNLPSRYAKAVSNWEAEKKAFFEQQEEEKRLFDFSAKEECDKEKEFLRNLINGSVPAVEEVFDSWIETCELPVEIDIDYDWDATKGVMFLDVDLPNFDCLSISTLVKTDSGNIKEKKKTQTELRSEYVRLVFGIAIFISANAFNVSPAIQKIVFSGYGERENKEGIISEDYLYSLKFTRDIFEKTDFSTIEPKAFCMMAEHRCNLTTTSMFKTIVPFDSFD